MSRTNSADALSDAVRRVARCESSPLECGHLLGSASIELEVRGPDGDGPLRLLFSGDIGPDFKLLQPDPDAPHDLPYVVCEGTYGDTDRVGATAESRRKALRDEVRAARNPKGAASST